MTDIDDSEAIDAAYSAAVEAYLGKAGNSTPYNVAGMDAAVRAVWTEAVHRLASPVTREEWAACRHPDTGFYDMDTLNDVLSKRACRAYASNLRQQLAEARAQLAQRSGAEWQQDVASQLRTAKASAEEEWHARVDAEKQLAEAQDYAKRANETAQTFLREREEAYAKLERADAYIKSLEDCAASDSSCMRSLRNDLNAADAKLERLRREVESARADSDSEHSFVVHWTKRASAAEARQRELATSLLAYVARERDEKRMSADTCLRAVCGTLENVLLGIQAQPSAEPKPAKPGEVELLRGMVADILEHTKRSERAVVAMYRAVLAGDQYPGVAEVMLRELGYPTSSQPEAGHYPVPTPKTYDTPA